MTEQRIPESWRAGALCSQTSPDAFFPEDGNSADAKRICDRCEVRGQCLAYALENNECYGIWGGLSAKERRKLLNDGEQKRRPVRQMAKDKRDARIKKLAANKLTVAAIAADVGVTERTVHRVLQK